MACAKSELCIFDGPLPQVVIDSSSFEEIFPTNSITADKQPVIEFNIIGSNTDYLDLNDTLLFIDLKVVDDKKAILTDASDVVPGNYMFHTLFSDVILSLNNIVIEGGNANYAPKALIETVLNYGADTRDTTLSSIGYDADSADRKKWIAKSQSFTMCGSLQLDFFDQPKYLIPGVNVNLKLKRNHPNLSLKSDAGAPLIFINEAKLFVRRVKVEPSVLIGHQIGLNTQNAIYPIRKTRLVTHTIPQGSSSFFKDQIFGDERLPKFVLVTFQSAKQKNGDYKSDCSTFSHLNVTNMTLSRNTDFRETYTQDFDANYVTSYVSSIVRNMGHLDKNLNCGITHDDFKDKYPFFTFVLAPDFDVNTTQLPKQGNLKLDIKFKAGITSPAVVHIYGIFDSDIQINKNRTIFI